MMGSFENKRILVTGAGAGIGKAIAIELHLAGAQVVALSLLKEELDILNKDYPGIRTVQADVKQWKHVQDVVGKLGHFDGLVNNAGIAIIRDFVDATEEDFDKTYAINVKGVLAVSQPVVKAMIASGKPGSIVNVSSQASQAALPAHVVYCSSKAAVDGMTRVMALDLGPHNIRVNTVNPTVTMTDMGRQVWSKPEESEPMLAKIPLGRFAQVEEVVHAVLFLLNDKASMINGVHLPVDGGFWAT